MPTPPMCATHTAAIYESGGVTFVGPLDRLINVTWQRIRDDISRASVSVEPACCAALGELGTVIQELHIFRDGEPVWQGIITRIEYEDDQVQLFAEDILWVTKRRALERGYNYTFTGGGGGPQSAVVHAGDSLGPRCYEKYGDPWNMGGNIIEVNGPSDPLMSRAINAWSMTVWEDLDYIAQYFGIDYVVVNRQVYIFETHLDWNPLPALDEAWLNRNPRIVEYGNSFANRFIKTDGSGYAGIATAGSANTDIYTQYIDFVANEVEQLERQNDALNRGEPEVPTPTELAAWRETAVSRLADIQMPQTSIVIPGGTTLLPTTTWDVDILTPGSWFPVEIDRACKSLSEYHKLNEVKVTETGTEGETVSIASSSAPATRVVLP